MDVIQHLGDGVGLPVSSRSAQGQQREIVTEDDYRTQGVERTPLGGEDVWVVFVEPEE